MKILCAGEALIDFISTEPGKKLKDVEKFEKRPGGAPLNVAVGLSRLGSDVTFLTKISGDSFGRFLLEFMENEGVDVSKVVIDRDRHTTLAFVSIDESGKPDFEFFNENSADRNLNLDEIDLDFEKYSLFHFGSISMIWDPTAETLLEIFRKFTEIGLTTSFDPNIRSNVIPDKNSYLERVHEILERADIVKLSDEDLEYMGFDDIEEFVRALKRQDKMTFLTLGADGSVGYFMGRMLKMKAWTPSEVIDTTGCGDAYMAGLIHILNGKTTWDVGVVEEAMEFATKVAGFVATKKGGANSMPRFQEVGRF